MFASGTCQHLDVWMDAGLCGGDWRDALDLTAASLGADAMVMVYRDHSANVTSASVGSDASIDFVLHCRELAAERHTHPQQCYAPYLGFINWASATAGPAERRLSVTVFALHRTQRPPAPLQPVAVMAACSVGVKMRLAAVQSSSALKTAAFDQLSFGIVIVDERLRAVEMNEACRSLIARSDGLGLVQGRLLCRDRGDQTALVGAVTSALKAAGCPPVVRVLRSGGVEPYVVRAICAGKSESNCLLMIADPDGGPPLASDVWRAMFDLTDCELIIAQGIVAGRKINEIACQRGVSVETVRTQIKRMFARLNVSSQAEAAARLSRVASFRLPEPA